MALNGLGLRVYACFGAVGLLSASISSEWYELEAEAIPRVMNGAHYRGESRLNYKPTNITHMIQALCLF